MNANDIREVLDQVRRGEDKGIPFDATWQLAALAGQKIQAIKLYRAHHRSALKEAKHAVEVWMSENMPQWKILACSGNVTRAVEAYLDEHEDASGPEAEDAIEDFEKGRSRWRP